MKTLEVGQGRKGPAEARNLFVAIRFDLQDFIYKCSASNMSIEARERLRKQRGTPVFVYDVSPSMMGWEDFTLLYIFNAKNYMYNTINIHHKTLNDCLDKGEVYLDTFFFSLDEIEGSSTNLLTLDEIKALVSNKSKIEDF